MADHQDTKEKVYLTYQKFSAALKNGLSDRLYCDKDCDKVQYSWQIKIDYNEGIFKMEYEN